MEGSGPPVVAGVGLAYPVESVVLVPPARSAILDVRRGLARLAPLLALAVGALLGVAAGCVDSSPTGAAALPTAPAPPTAPTAPTAAPAFPPPVRPGDIYLGQGVYDTFASYHGGWLVSRYVLHADATFELEFSSGRWGYFAYTGRYARTDSTVVFDWDAWNIGGAWGATATVRGDTLGVRYNDIMIGSDFVDGVYVRARATP